MRALLAAATARLAGADARGEAELLLAHALGRTRAALFAWPEHVPEPPLRSAFETLVDARALGTPIAYLLGRRAFRTFELAVTPAVLIPRPETEHLVECVLERVPADVPRTVADLGTGSGAIALAIALERPQARVLATDASEAALAVARANAASLGVRNVAFAHGDWCAALGDARFDVIASNPPYIAADDPHLARGDLRFEPASALASGADGLDAIRAITAQASACLNTGGWLLFEHGWDQAGRVRDLLVDTGFDAVASVRDLAGHERITLGRWAARAGM